MSLVAWNCRGLGRPSVIPDLKYLVRRFNPDILFLSETLVHRNKIEAFRYVLGYDACLSVDRTGRSGGLAIFWRSTLNCNLINYSNNHITLEIINNVLGTWRLTGYYGYPNGERRQAAWNFLRNLSNEYAGPWCIFGDFNDIMDDCEKRGRTIRPRWLINGFRQAVLDSGLSDVPLEGYPFTWFKSLGTPRAVEERLDRALANNAWFNIFPNAMLETLAAPASDHYPILLHRSYVPRAPSTNRKFRYENAWKLEPGFHDMVTNSWHMNASHPIIPKLTACAADMSLWSRNNCRKLKHNIEECSRQIKLLRDNNTGVAQSQLLEVRKKMQRLLAQDDAYWKQRAKTHWNKDGDRNTKFFHASASARKKVNRILSLEDNEGNKITDSQGMQTTAKDYFVELFQKQHNVAVPVINVIRQSITVADNELLTAPFSKAEFRDAMFSMHPDKCPGSDGFNPGFYQHFWNLCSDEIFKECCAWLDSGYFPPDLNMTNIALIPKGNLQTSMRDWRPIALCIVLYKLISKVLANRLKAVLPKCISDSQSAFVPSRSILDNAMAAIEVIHFMQTKTRGNDRYVALKLDISKAYDRMDWDYLRDVMVKIGFNNKWIHWISMCVESVDYSVIVNNEPVGPVIPGRGLRQGDPLSPYLFIICAEGLSSLIQDAEQRQVISGTRICRTAPAVSHLLFADDCFLFFKANESEAQAMKDILSTYESASGQAISLPKSEIFCSRNVPEPLRNNLAAILGVQAVLGTGKYLGLPSLIGRNRNSTFAYIKDRVWQKINPWSSKCLSKAGREVMIKSVLQAIPSYVMSIFQLPTTLINTIEKMMNSFWWGHGRTNQRGINWLRWEKLSMHKVNGGLGFKDLTAFNLAMLGKQGWKFLTEPNSLVSRMYKARYFPNNTFLTATIGHNPSYVWRSIFRARFIVRGGARWSIGSGESIRILGEPWLLNGECSANDITGAQHVREVTIDKLLLPHAKQWNESTVRQVFSADLAEKIMNTPLIAQVQADRLIWKAEKHGKYSVKSAYRLCVEELIDTSHLRRPGNWLCIWKLQVPPKIRNLVWRICRGCLPTRIRLQDKGIQCPTQCVSCASNHEDVEHLFFACPFAIQVWCLSGMWSQISNLIMNGGAATDVIFTLLAELPAAHKQIFGATVWSLWKHRNLKVWENVSESAAVVVDRARVLISEWQIANSKVSEGDAADIAGATTHLSFSSSAANVHAAGQLVWQKPGSGRLKCNVDAAFSSNFNRTGIGVCIRDEEGAFVLAKMINFPCAHQVAVGEAMGLFEALQWLSDMSFDNIDFELDSKITCDAFHSRREDVSEFGHIIASCKALFSAFFTNSRVEFIRRQTNAAAHVLAREATFLASPIIYYHIPSCIETIIITEMQ
jgi:hypothetical protein